MGMFTRLTDIVNANINAMLDKAEDPQKLVRMLIQEMEETLVEVRAEAARHIAEKKTVVRQLESLNAAAADWQKKAEIAVTKDREDLARAALIEKAKQEEKAHVVQTEFNKVEDMLAALQEDVARLQTKLSEAKARQNTLLKRQNTAVVRLQSRQKIEKLNIEKTLARFDLIERKVEQVEAQVEAYELAPENDLHAQFRQLENEGKIDQELAALKKKMMPSKQAVA